MTLRLHAHPQNHGPTLPVDCAGLTPEALAPLSLAEIERLPVRVGQHSVALGEVFRIAGDPAATDWIVEPGPLRLNRLGEGMALGRVEVLGDLGDAACGRMSGGTVVVRGRVAAQAGVGMRGGLLRVIGDAGDELGGVAPGQRRGMAGGILVVHGSAGTRVGQRMRRGLIAIAGTVGPLLGLQMIAGTCVVAGPTGLDPGAGMKRGLLALLGGLPDPSPRFLSAGPYGGGGRVSFLPLLAQHLSDLEFPLPPPLHDQLRRHPLHRYRGDLNTLGLGEVLTAQPWE